MKESWIEKLINPTPFWRVVDHKSNLAKKLACGSKFIRDMRALEAD